MRLALPLVLVATTALAACTSSGPRLERAVADAPPLRWGCGPDVVRVELELGAPHQPVADVLSSAPGVAVRGWARTPGDGWAVAVDAEDPDGLLAAIGERAVGVRYAGVEPAPCPGVVLALGAAFGVRFPLDGVVAFTDGEWVVETRSGAYRVVGLPADLREAGLDVEGVGELASRPGPTPGDVASVRAVWLRPAPRQSTPHVDYEPGDVSVSLREGVEPPAFEAWLAERGLEARGWTRSERWYCTVRVPGDETEAWVIRFRRDAGHLVISALADMILRPRTRAGGR